MSKEHEKITMQYSVIGNHADMNSEIKGGILVTSNEVTVINKDEPHESIFGFFYNLETGEIYQSINTTNE
jgi:hypothetical protein